MLKIFEKLDAWMERNDRKRIIYDRDNVSPYMIRYYLWRKRNVDGEGGNGANLFLHKILRSDSDNHLHDHPWDWATFLIKGSYIEVLPNAHFEKPEFADDGELDTMGRIKQTYYTRRNRFTFRKKSAKDYHQLKLIEKQPVWTLFWHGKRIQKWGFFVNGKRIYWKDYLKDRL